MNGRLASRMRSFSTLRSPDNNPLTNDQIMRVAPSIFAAEPHHTRSERYAYIPTSQVLAALQNEGFQPFSVSQSRTRIVDRREHTRHLIRLRHVNDIQNPEAAHEIALLNSHDGTSSYQILSGMFRYICANGLVCGDIEHDIRLRHKGNIMDDVIEGVYSVMARRDDIADQVDAMRAITLNTAESIILAESALDLRFGEESHPITTAQMLQARRVEDAGNTLWQTFNRLQENAIDGGMLGRTKTGKVRKVREITGMDQDTKLNRSLWTLAQKMAELKAA